MITGEKILPRLFRAERVVMYGGTAWCSDCRRVAKVLEEHNVPFQEIDFHEDPVAAFQIQLMIDGDHITHSPRVFFSRGDTILEMLVEPDNNTLINTLSRHKLGTFGRSGLSTSAKAG